MSEDNTSPVKYLGEKKSLWRLKKKKRNQKTLKSFLCTTPSYIWESPRLGATRLTLRDNGNVRGGVGGRCEGAEQGTAVLEPAVQR